MKKPKIKQEVAIAFACKLVGIISFYASPDAVNDFQCLQIIMILL